MLYEYLTQNKYIQNQADHCVYTRQGEHEKVIIVIWVDDLVIAASDEKAMNVTKDMLTARFKMRDLGKLRFFLGIDFSQSDDCVTMSQAKYVVSTCKIVNQGQHLVNKN